jgi:NDP-sugar pyrophosphorylase family protein
MGTAGAYKFAESFLTETTVVFNGDILTDIELTAVLEYHKRRQSLATIVLTAVENPSAYGVVVTGGDGRVEKFVEKPNEQVLQEIGTNNINAGIYILEPEVLKMIPAGESYSFEYQLFPALLAQSENFYAFVRPGTYWKDIGTPQRYLEAHHDLLSGRVKNFKLDTKRGDAEISHTAEIDDKSLIADGCVIKPGARITNSVLGAGVYVEEKAVIENSVIWQHTRVNTFAHISNAVVGRGCHIGRFAVVGANSVLGDKTSLTDYTQV